MTLIVNTYVRTVTPVGSKAIAEKLNYDLSSATVRNEMAELEEFGFIGHPHTSAGRIPTDKGYRYYVSELLEPKAVEPSEATLVAREYRERVRSIEELIERTSKILSFLTEQAGLILYPNHQELVLKRIEVIPYGSRHLLVVWATTTGIVKNKMVDMEEQIPQSDLVRLNAFLNSELSGKRFADIQPHLRESFREAKDSLQQQYVLAQEIISRTLGSEDERRVCLDGSRFVLKQPEFREDSEKARTFFRTLETKEALLEAFRDELSPGEVKVRIGRENSQREMWDCSLVTTHYYFQEKPLGVLGVLGPKRMSYGRVICLVDCVARRLSGVLEELL